MTNPFDAIVLGAGIVGVSTAVHLQRCGLAVALVDRKTPGTETSYGNAGLIQREGVYPYAFPRQLATLLKYAGNRAPDVRYHLGALLKTAPFLLRYWRHSRSDRHAAIARLYAPLIEHCVAEHRALADAAGAGGLIRHQGWFKIFHDARTQEAQTREAQKWFDEFGVAFEACDAAALRQAEPDLSASLVGGLRYPDADTVSDPGALAAAYARHFESLGGRILHGDANTLEPGWKVRTREGDITARAAVVALGPWSGDLVNTRLRYRLPLAVKRGYHRHYEPAPGARLNHPVLDVANGFLLAPMSRGIRVTTGIEFADRDAPKTPAQMAAVEPMARGLFPLGRPVEAEPWMGARPCTPDMLPIIGPAPRHKDLWFAFGHAHHGLTLGPVTGRLIAQMMTGAQTFVDPAPFRADRF